MNYIEKTALFIGVATAINGLSFAAQAQFFADPSHTAATKARLDQIAQSQGIEMGDVGKAYENFALATIRPGTPIPENTRRFFSSARKRETNDKFQNVVPDGVLPLVFVNFPAGPTETYANSVFYEVKALSGGLLPLVTQIIKFSVSLMHSVTALPRQQAEYQQSFFSLAPILGRLVLQQ